MGTPNVCIFNKIKHNDADIRLLTETFSSLQCTVKEVKNATLEVLQREVTQIVQTDFTKFNYVIIIVLDNTNKHPGIWTTTDGQNFHINGDLLTALYANQSLKGKLRLGILQTNRELNEYEPVFRNYDQVPNIYPLIDVKFYATSLGTILKHKWQSDQQSPFIRILCEEIKKCANEPEKVSIILNNIAARVQMETGELPAKEMGTDPGFLAHALK